MPCLERTRCISAGEGNFPALSLSLPLPPRSHLSARFILQKCTRKSPLGRRGCKCSRTYLEEYSSARSISFDAIEILKQTSTNMFAQDAVKSDRTRERYRRARASVVRSSTLSDKQECVNSSSANMSDRPQRERKRATQWIDRLGSSMTWVVQFEGCPFFAEVGAAACRFSVKRRSEDEGASRRTNRAKVTVFHLLSPFKK